MFFQNVTKNIVILDGVRMAPGDVAEFPDEKAHDRYFMACVTTARLRKHDGPAKRSKK